jgi:hypothetical protein
MNPPDVSLQTLHMLALLLYVGPDQALPLLSILGAIVGVVLMWWRRLVSLTRRAFRSFARRTE